MASPEIYHEAGAALKYEQERAQRRKEEALSYLVDSGRSENREVAEQYLNTLNRVKEQLLKFSQDYVSRESNTRQKGIEQPSIGYGELEATRDMLGEITPEDLDRANPELWKLERQVESSYTDYLPERKASLGENGVMTRDRIQIGLAEGRPPIEIHPEMVSRGAVAYRGLQEYLTDEDLAFVAKEYGFAAQDLARVLAAVSRRVAAYKSPTDSIFLEHFSQGKK